jgi:hypothetical protein
MHDYTTYICTESATMLYNVSCVPLDIGVRVVYTQYQETRCMWAHQISELLADPITLFDNSSYYRNCHYQRMLVSSCAVSLTYGAWPERCSALNAQLNIQCILRARVEQRE